MKRKALAVALAALVLAGCAPTAGVIHDKRHDDGGSYWTTLCNGRTCIPVQNYRPPSWDFDLYADDGDHGWHSVSSDTYARYAVGDYYSEEETR